ncbi:MAG TPA: 2-dehydropantoate 2-reductase [Stellaceae bacterium]|jgi:2-dehydropantoate 2-reductase
MRFLVLGAGAIGGYYGGRLLEAGGDVTFLVRPRRAAQLAEHGLVIKSAAGDFRSAVKSVTTADSAYDIVLLTCKSYDLDSALDAIAPALGPDSAVLPLLNGIAHLDAIAARFGAHRTMAGCAYISTALLPSGEIQHFDRMDILQFGELDGRETARLAALAALFAKAKTNAAASTTILQSMWDKWMTLAGAGAALTLVRGNVGDLLDAPTGMDLLRTIFDECGSVATAYGYPPSPAVGAMVASAPQRRGFITSMTRDLIEGRRTEGDHIIGDLVARAAAKNIPVPTLRAALTNLQVHEARLGRA